MQGASHVEHQEQPLSKCQSEHLLSTPIHGGRVEQARLGWECDLYHATAAFTCLLILLMQPHRVSPPPCPWLTFSRRVGVGTWMTPAECIKLSVCMLCGGSRLHSWFMLFPGSNLAALQPCSQVSIPGLVNAALQSFLLLALGIKPWVLGERIGFPFCFIYIFLWTHPILQHCKMKALPVVSFVSCWGEGQKELGEIKQWKLEWNGGVWKTRRLRLWKAGSGLGEKSPFMYLDIVLQACYVCIKYKPSMYGKHRQV